MVRTPFLAAVTLAALALAPAAHAQSLTLNSGDNVTVSSAGTVGIIGGKTVASATSSYNDSDAFYAVETSGTSTFTLAAGGTLTTAQNGYGLDADGSGTVMISGGTITAATGDAVLAYSQPVTLTGGKITAGTNGVGLFAYPSGVTGPNGGTINLFSLGDTPFLINNVPMNNTTLTSGGFSGTIQGTLLNGDLLDTTFTNFGIINLNTPAAAPEPSQFVAFTAGLLGLGALALKAKKRQAA